MKASQKPGNIHVYASSIFLMLTLLWLTISLPFVYVPQAIALSSGNGVAHSPTDNREETENPFANTTEEKTANNLNSVAEEFLHESHPADHCLDSSNKIYAVENVPIFIAYYGELISPPPESC